MLPYLTNQAPSFAFLIHPRDDYDLYQMGGAQFILDNSEDNADFKRKICTMPPLVVGEIRFGFSQIWGELIAAAKMPRQLISKSGPSYVRETFEVALSRGTKVVGLGALTSPMTRGGQKLQGIGPAGTRITNGNGYTAHVTSENVKQASEHLAMGDSAVVAIVGCTGSVGRPTAQLLDDLGFRLVLIGRNEKRVYDRIGELAKRHTVSSSLESLKNVDIVVLLTTESVVLPSSIKPSSIVIDCCQPAAIEKEQCENLANVGVKVVAGGLVSIPNYRCSYDLRMPSEEYAFACLAETFLFAAEGIPEDSVGTPSLEFAQYMGRVGERHGVKVRSLEFELEAELSPPDKKAMAYQDHSMAKIEMEPVT